MKIHNHVIVALSIHLFFMFFLGVGVVRSAIVFLIDGSDIGAFSFNSYDGVGKSFLFFLQSSFLFGWEIFLLPVIVIFFATWLYICLISKSIRIIITENERKLCVKATYVVPFVLLVAFVVTLPTDFLFLGPTYGFNPLSPILKSLSAILVPHIFWYFLDNIPQKLYRG